MMFNWKWNLSELKNDKPIKVFSCFSCGGGSSMGYKKAGFSVIGNCEIDEKVNKVYKENLHPKYNFLMDLRDFNKLENLPEELYNLDILDGSPPCSTFSFAGQREKNWGKEKKFREGQKKQVLDDLFFVFLDTVKKLNPKIVIAENVIGLLKGNAKGYVNLIVKKFHELGYDVQIFKLNSAFMNVPQSRERVFFIANRMNFPKLKLSFNEKPIKFGDVRSEHGIKIKSKITEKILSCMQPKDFDMGDILRRTENRDSRFVQKIFHDEFVAPTLVATSTTYRACDRTYISNEDIVNVSSFPQDYNFLDQKPQYICGMSVPPNMTANIAMEVWKQWLNK